MKKILISLCLLNTVIAFAQDENEPFSEPKKNSYSFEIGATMGFPVYTDLNDLDKALAQIGKPAISDDVDIASNLLVNSLITLRCNRWGLTFGNYTANFKTGNTKFIMVY